MYLVRCLQTSAIMTNFSIKVVLDTVCPVSFDHLFFKNTYILNYDMRMDGLKLLCLRSLCTILLSLHHQSKERGRFKSSQKFNHMNIITIDSSQSHAVVLPRPQTPPKGHLCISSRPRIRSHHGRRLDRHRHFHHHLARILPEPGGAPLPRN